MSTKYDLVKMLHQNLMHFFDNECRRRDMRNTNHDVGDLLDMMALSDFEWFKKQIGNVVEDFFDNYIEGYCPECDKALYE